jgi:hypothetical protein
MNCDEYYSYNALAGLVKQSEEEVVKWDPYELVVEAINRMVKNGDVMRSDRLKQVMQDIDPSFDEKNLGKSKFSKFCQDAAEQGLIKVTKLENGQLEVAPTEQSARAGTGGTPAPRTRRRGTCAVTVPPRQATERRGRGVAVVVAEAVGVAAIVIGTSARDANVREAVARTEDACLDQRGAGWCRAPASLSHRGAG